MVHATRLELFQLRVFLIPGERVLNPVWHFFESKLFTKPMPERENGLRVQMFQTGVL